MQFCVPCQINSRFLPHQVSFARRWGLVLFVGNLLMAILVQFARAQGNDIVFDALTYQANGLPIGQVQAILQDRHGFMWFGTQSGLAKKDGLASNCSR
jgi:hypothetical protein